MVQARRGGTWWRRGRAGTDEMDFDLDVLVGLDLPPEPVVSRQPTVWDDPRIDSKAMLMSLYGIARRVYRVCWVILGACALLTVFGLFGSTLLGQASDGPDNTFWVKLALYIGLFLFFGWLIVSANYAMEGLERRAQFQPNLKPWTIRGDREPDVYDAPRPLQPILVIRREGTNAEAPTVGEAARRHKLVFNTVFAVTPALTFLPDALRSGDRLLGFGGLAIWCYFCYVAARDGLYVLDTWIDEHLTGTIEGE